MADAVLPSRKEILVIGNSHTTAMAAALDDETRPRIDVVNLASYFDPVNRRNKVLPPDIVELFQPERIFCTFGGSEHNVFGLLEAPIRFDFMTATESAVEAGRRIVPYALIRAALEQAMQNAIKHTRELHRLYPHCPITHLCTPPPFRAIAEGRVLPRVFQDHLHLGITPASIRRKLHQVHSDIARDACVAMGVGFMDVPSGCTDDDGYLLPEFWSKDPTHGNAKFGALLIGRMLEHRHG
jgi:hypothetical protein